MPTPIQLGAITDRLRKFLRIRGKLPLLLDEVVVPMVLIQDLTVGPYQAGVSPCAGSESLNIASDDTTGTIAIFLQDKPASITPELGPQFDGRSFSGTFIDMQNNFVDPAIDVQMLLTGRAQLIAAGVPSNQTQLTSIQENPDGLATVPVAIAAFNAVNVAAQSALLWRGRLEGLVANNSPTVREIQATPQNTIGPKDVILLKFTTGTLGGGPGIQVRFNIRGFYQQQPN